MHDLGGGRTLVPLLQPVADELPFAVALELHTCRDDGDSAAEPDASGSEAEDSSFQLHYVLQGQAQVGMDVNALLPSWACEVRYQQTPHTTTCS
jgi:hypothetical protein